MYRPITLFIKIIRPWKTDGDDPLYSDLQQHFIQQQTEIGGELWEVSGQPLQRHPTDPYCVYTPWYMVDMGLERSMSDDFDYGTGIVPIFKKYGFTYPHTLVHLSTVANGKDKYGNHISSISGWFDDGISDADKPEVRWMEPMDKSVSVKEYNEMMDKFKKVEVQWKKKYPLPTFQVDSDSDESMDFESDSDEDSNDSSNYGSYWNYGSGVTMDEKAKARQTLGITNRDPTDAEVRKAYRKKAREAHSDKGGSDEAMKSVNNARDILLPNKFKPVLKF